MTMLHNARFDIKFVIKANCTISVLPSLSWTMVSRKKKQNNCFIVFYIHINQIFDQLLKKQDQCAKNKEESFPWEIQTGNNIK